MAGRVEGNKLNTQGGDTWRGICMEKVYDSLPSSSRYGRSDFFELFMYVRLVDESCKCVGR